MADLFAKFRTLFAAADQVYSATGSEVKFIVSLADLYNNPQGMVVREDEKNGVYNNTVAGTIGLNLNWFKPQAPNNTRSYERFYKPFVGALVNEFKDDAHIFAWELGNELQAKEKDDSTKVGDVQKDILLAFSYDMGHYIKDQLSAQQMVSTGFISTKHAINSGAAINGATVAEMYDTWATGGDSPLDYVTIHSYNNEWSNPPCSVACPFPYQGQDSDYVWARGKMPYVVGEFGFNGAYSQSATQCSDPPYPGGSWNTGTRVIDLPKLNDHTQSRLTLVTNAVNGFFDDFAASGLMTWGFSPSDHGDVNLSDHCAAVDPILHSDWKDLIGFFTQKASTLNAVASVPGVSGAGSSYAGKVGDIGFAFSSNQTPGTLNVGHSRGTSPIDNPNMRFLNGYWNIAFADSGGTTIPDGTFATNITFTYPDGLVADETTLMPTYYDPAAQAWKIATVAARDTTKNTITATTSHFSRWGIATPAQLYLPFENTRNGQLGEVGSLDGATAPTFTTGHDGSGIVMGTTNNRVSYPINGNLTINQGSIAFWLKPTWNGNDGLNYTFFEAGDTFYNRLRIAKDAANNVRFLIWNATTEFGLGTSVATWTANQWHHIRVTWGSGTMQLYLDGMLRGNRAVTLPSTLSSSVMYVGASASDGQRASAVMDEFVISPPARPAGLNVTFDGAFKGNDREAGFLDGATAPTFVTGHSGSGAQFTTTNNRLYYPIDDNLNIAQGSIAFWIKPTWNGNDGLNYTFFEAGDTFYNRLRIAKDAANNVRFLIWNATTEFGLGTSVATWTANQWHQVRVTWGSGTMQLYLDGALRGSRAVTLPSTLSSSVLYVGASASDGQRASAVIDDLVISE